jgi:hypothetical protein
MGLSCTKGDRKRKAVTDLTANLATEATRSCATATGASRTCLSGNHSGEGQGREHGDERRDYLVLKRHV